MTLTHHDILNHIQARKPLSIIRAGDGEKIILDSNKSLTNQRKALDAVPKRQMGYEPNVTTLEDIRANLINAYTNADIIGIPMHKNLSELSSSWQNVKSALDENAPLHPANYCSIDVHYDFLNAGYFNTALTGISRLNYISCRNLQERMQSKWSIEVVNGYHIAPEAKFTSGYDGDVHYPTQFNKAARWMDVVCRPGDLLLVGAGVIGKIYCNWWRDRGGVAFDIGSIFDEFAGMITRGPERGLDKIDENSKWKI